MDIIGSIDRNLFTCDVNYNLDYFNNCFMEISMNFCTFLKNCYDFGLVASILGAPTHDILANDIAVFHEYSVARWQIFVKNANSGPKFTNFPTKKAPRCNRSCATWQ